MIIYFVINIYKTNFTIDLKNNNWLIQTQMKQKHTSASQQNVGNKLKHGILSLGFAMK